DAIGGRDWLGDDRRDRLGILELDFLLEGVGAGDVVLFAAQPRELRPVVVRRGHMVDARHEGAEVLLGADAGQAHRAESHAVVRAAPGDDLVAPRETAHRLDLLGDLHRAFDRFGAAGAEEQPVEVAGQQVGDRLAEGDGRDGGVVAGGDIGQARGLLLHRLADLGAAVAGVDDPQAGDAVQVFLAIDIVEPGALAAIEDLHALLFGELLPRRAMDPDVFERGFRQLVGRCDSHAMLSLTRPRQWERAAHIPLRLDCSIAVIVTVPDVPTVRANRAFRCLYGRRATLSSGPGHTPANAWFGASWTVAYQARGAVHYGRPLGRGA